MPTNQPDELELRATRAAFDAVIASVHQITVLAAAGEPIASSVREMLWRFTGTLTDALAAVEGMTPREIAEQMFQASKDDQLWRAETLPKLEAYGWAIRESDEPEAAQSLSAQWDARVVRVIDSDGVIEEGPRDPD